MPTSTKLLLGAHLSIAGGLEQALITGANIGCTAIQIFTKSNRQWQARPITTTAAQLFHATQKQSGISIVGAHASYLINLGSPDPTTRHKSVAGLTIELQRCELLQIPYLILHPGNGLGSSENDCLQLIAQHIDLALTNSPGDTMLLLENMAGQGHTTGYKFSQLAEIYRQVKHKSRLGICFDTCHAFAAGYDLSTPAGYQATWQEFQQHLDLKLLKFIHINDSKQMLDARVDRHEHIGRGKIGLKGFELLLNDQNLIHIPKILETPKEQELQADIKNLQTLVSLLDRKNRKLITNTNLAIYENTNPFK